jgi:alpha-tubulin suppressor-like RCC1 family protein
VLLSTRPYMLCLVPQVTCGRFHTICVTAQSQVFAWGHNSAGQLGLSDRRDRWVFAETRCLQQLVAAV